MFSSIISLSVLLPFIVSALPLDEPTCNVPHMRLILGNHVTAQKEYAVPLFSGCNTGVMNTHPIQITELNTALTTLTSFGYDLTQIVDANNNPFPRESTAWSALLNYSHDRSIDSVIAMIGCSISIKGHEVARLSPLDATRKGGLRTPSGGNHLELENQVLSILCSVEKRHMDNQKRNRGYAFPLSARWDDDCYPGIWKL
ncbi:hypothetical protein BJ875DRAFT_519931 [Amylocarpus encephaloides]|uniref:Ecp2 effector protein domain-containing protein n=1 Tax=Amylocarpus encephaloides TaxID=45428 RepID=A0A9P7YPC5_9HELO|nr:hypothetical protein BJ875DRAFT_519931 [Amylocarpus encephaloides]